MMIQVKRQKKEIKKLIKNNPQKKNLTKKTQTQILNQKNQEQRKLPKKKKIQTQIKNQMNQKNKRKIMMMKNYLKMPMKNYL